MTARIPTDLLAHAHDAASNAASHVIDTLSSTLEHTIDQAKSLTDQAKSLAPARRRRRSRAWLPLVIVLAGAAAFVAMRRRGGSKTAMHGTSDADGTDATGTSPRSSTTATADAA